jgi:ABC-2 type transport system permease protein
MAWVFVRLKTRLLLNGLRRQGWRIILVVLGGVYAIPLAGVGFALLASTSADSADGPTISVLVGTALVLGWTTIPLLGLGSDGALDPIRLTLLPLSRRQLMTGLLAAAFVGIGSAMTGVTLIGAVVGFAPGGPGAALVVLAAVGQLLVCVCASRAVLAWLSSALRSRRGRDLRVIVVALVALAPQAVRIMVVRRGGNNLAQYRGVADVAGWLPTALPMRAMAAAGRGHLVTSATELATSAIVIVALVWWWAASLDRMLTTAEALPGGRPTPRDSTAEPLFGAVFAWLPRTRAGAVAAREFRTTWRDPRRRVQLVTSALLPFLVLAGFLTRGVAHRTGLVYSALLIIGLAGGGRGYNQIGFDGRAWWLHEACGADYSSDLRGKNVALALTTLPVVVLAAGILAALTGGWLAFVAVVLMALGLEGVQLAIGNVLSVRAPWSVPQSSTNLWATGTGQGCLVGMLGLAGLAVQAILALPFVIVAIATKTPAARIVTGMATIPYGFGIWILGTRWAVRLGANRGAEILAAVSGDQAPA